MDVYIFLRNHVGEVPVVERLPSTIYASSDEEVLPNESTMRLTPEVAISQLEIILSLPDCLREFGFCVGWLLLLLSHL